MLMSDPILPTLSEWDAIDAALKRVLMHDDEPSLLSPSCVLRVSGAPELQYRLRLRGSPSVAPDPDVCADAPFVSRPFVEAWLQSERSARQLMEQDEEEEDSFVLLVYDVEVVERAAAAAAALTHASSSSSSSSSSSGRTIIRVPWLLVAKSGLAEAIPRALHRDQRSSSAPEQLSVVTPWVQGQEWKNSIARYNQKRKTDALPVSLGEFRVHLSPASGSVERVEWHSYTEDEYMARMQTSWGLSPAPVSLAARDEAQPTKLQHASAASSTAPRNVNAGAIKSGSIARPQTGEEKRAVQQRNPVTGAAASSSSSSSSSAPPAAASSTKKKNPPAAASSSPPAFVPALASSSSSSGPPVLLRQTPRARFWPEVEASVFLGRYAGASTTRCVTLLSLEAGADSVPYDQKLVIAEHLLTSWRRTLAQKSTDTSLSLVNLNPVPKSAHNAAALLDQLQWVTHLVVSARHIHLPPDEEEQKQGHRETPTGDDPNLYNVFTQSALFGDDVRPDECLHRGQKWPLVGLFACEGVVATDDEAVERLATTGRLKFADSHVHQEGKNWHFGSDMAQFRLLPTSPVSHAWCVVFDDTQRKVDVTLVVIVAPDLEDRVSKCVRVSMRPDSRCDLSTFVHNLSEGKMISKQLERTMRTIKASK